MIIIKDQDGNTFEYIGIEAASMDNCRHNQFIHGMLPTGDKRCLGEYESRDRVVEVMDEIESHIEYVHSESMYYKYGSDNQASIPDLIFEMPKE